MTENQITPEFKVTRLMSTLAVNIVHFHVHEPLDASR
jgi:hypothetical protein